MTAKSSELTSGSSFRPAEVFPLVDFLRDEIRHRGWGELAFIHQHKITDLFRRLEEGFPLDPEGAERLGNVFRVSPRLFLDLDRIYRESTLGEFISS